MSTEAKTKYQQYRQEALDLLTKLTADIEANEIANPNWADVGDMTRINSDLAEIAQYWLDWD